MMFASIACRYFRRIQLLKEGGGFREQFKVNNLMYGIITFMAERIGGSSWEKLIKKELLDPIGMNNTSFFTLLEPEAENIATGYIQDEGMLRPVSFEFLR